MAAAGDEQVFVFGGDSFATKKLEQRLFERRVAVRGTKCEDVASFATEDGVDAVEQLVHGEKFLGRAGHDEGECVFGRSSGQSAQDFVAAFVGEKEFPTDAVVAV